MSVSFGFARGKPVVRKVRLRQGTLRVWARMVLDTGARVTAIAPRTLKQLGFDLDRAESTTGIVGAIGEASAPVVTVASVSLMAAEVKDLRVVCYSLHPKLGLDGVLGLNFLKHFDIEISHSTETLTLTKWR